MSDYSTPTSLAEILAQDDPLLNTPLNRREISKGNTWTVLGFEEINAFVDRHGRLPENRFEGYGIEEGLYGRLEAILENQALIEELRPYDRHGILAAGLATLEPEIVPPASLDEINDPILEETMELFEMRYALTGEERKTIEREQPDYIATRRQCDTFHLYEMRFAEINDDLQSGFCTSTRFHEGGDPIRTGDAFILKGIIAYIAGQLDRHVTKSGRENPRFRIIFSNGTEASMRLRSFTSALYKDSSGRRIVYPYPEPESFGGDLGQSSGTIYVLKSLSDNPEIAGARDILHKIGVTSDTLKNRLSGAENRPTFLMARVEVAASFALYNLNARKVEHLLHRFFDDARADITVTDRHGREFSPQEWFIIPVQAIRKAAELINQGQLHRYRYDPTLALVVAHEAGA